jgi:hypothetical protein
MLAHCLQKGLSTVARIIVIVVIKLSFIFVITTMKIISIVIANKNKASLSVCTGVSHSSGHGSYHKMCACRSFTAEDTTEMCSRSTKADHCSKAVVKSAQAVPP